ncbi:MAG: DNA translocase FtsK [Tannerella sp.]|nr:DNA translocase FtsK [Tannerella sp.]
MEDMLESANSFFSNERIRFIGGAVLLCVVIYLGVSCISYLFTGSADQSDLENLPSRELSGRIENWCGVWGARVSDWIMDRWFGIPSFFLLYFFGSLSARMMGIYTKMSLLKRCLMSTGAMLWLSVFLSFLDIGDTFFHYGGRCGDALTGMLSNNIGTPGLLLVLIAGLIILAICLSKRMVAWLQHLFSFAWLRPHLKPNLPRWSFRRRPQPAEPKETEATEIKDDAKTPDRGTTLVTSVKVDEDSEITFTVEKPVEEDDDHSYDISSLGVYDPRLDLSNYRFPTLDLLKKYTLSETPVDMEEQTENQRNIKRTLESFGVSISSIKATVGPTLTLYEVVPVEGIRISKIRNLEDDIALNLSALGIRIIAPMPGKGTIGIEVPNKAPQIVSMHSVIASRRFIENEGKYDLPVALGRTITNEVFMFDLCKAPHLLMAGATGQGKSVGLNAIITSLLYKKHPAELKFVLIDPKVVEFSIYENIEHHYLAKLPDEKKAIITDVTRVVYTLNSLCREMDDRYELLAKAQVRNIKDYNEKFINRRLNPEKGHKFMPYIVVIIDEFGDLIITAGKEIERPITRIAQKARAIGIHMIIATQRPTTNIITGTIKANFPVRVAFRVTSMVDSRTILDTPGANQLIGRGDLLYSLGSEITRVQCAFVDTPEVENISTFISEQQGYGTAFLLPEYVADEEGGQAGGMDLSDRDPLFDEAARLIVLQQQGSTSLIQRKFSIGYNRAGRLMDQLEKAGIVGPVEGSKPRQVLVVDEYSLEHKLNALK